VAKPGAPQNFAAAPKYVVRQRAQARRNEGQVRRRAVPPYEVRVPRNAVQVLRSAVQVRPREAWRQARRLAAVAPPKLREPRVSRASKAQSPLRRSPHAATWP
jgi:hypothetical protein